jgi:parallel beta-helix repeat protein
MAEGPPDSFLVLATSSASFDISKISVFSAGLFTTKPDNQREYSAASPIRRIAECLAHGKGSKIAGINLRFVSGVVVQGNFIDGYRHGVTIWGGESNPTKPTFVPSLWGSSNVVVTSNIICNPKMGGIWTSRAQNVRVCNNIVYNCGDVGLDAEGSRQITFAENAVVNSRNGNLAVFFSSERVRFEGNILLTTNSSWPQSRVYNSSLVAARHDGITYDANVFIGLDSSGKPGRFDNASGPMKNTRISRNIFVDTQIDFARHGAEATRIDSNIMLFSRAASIAYPAVRLRNGDRKIIVSNNVFWAPSGFKIQAAVEKGGAVSFASKLEEWGNIVEGFSCITARTAGN